MRNAGKNIFTNDNNCHFQTISEDVEPTDVLIESSEMGSLHRFQYCPVNIPGTGCNRELFEDELTGCDCANTCCTDSHNCLCFSSNPCVYDANRKLIGDWSKQTMIPIHECNINCSCSKDCINRVIQNGVSLNLIIFKTKMCGLGIKCLQDISKNTFICEYAGEVISKDEAKRRLSNKSFDCPNYILLLREHFSNKINETCVDPEYVGNVGRFLNHSCEPNLFMLPIRVNNPVPKLCLFSKQDIAAGTELRYNYSGVDFTEGCTQSTQVGKTEATNNRKKCYCDSQHCQGYLPFDNSLEM